MGKPSSSAVLDTGNALSTNLKAFWALLEGSGFTSADKTGNGFGLSLDASVTWSTDGAGDICIAEATATKAPAAVTTGFTLPSNADWSIAFRAKQSSSSNNNGMLIGRPSNPNYIGIFDGTDFEIRNNAAQTYFFNGETHFTADHDYLVTYDHTNSKYHLYIDGVEAGDSPKSSPTGAFDVYFLGTAYTGNSDSLVGTFTYCYVWSGRLLTVTDAGTLHSSPYGMLALPATSYATSLSSSFGTNGDPVTVTFTPNGITTGTITPTTDSTGVFSPTSLTWSGTGGAKTCTYTPSVTGVHHIDSTTTTGLTDTSGAQTYNSTTEGVLSITSPLPFQGYQITGSNITFPLSGTYTHSATGDGVVDYSVDNGSTWNTLATASGGAFSGPMIIPGTATANFTAKVRWHTDTISTASVPNQILGDVFIWGGDSNASGRGINNQNFTGTTGSVYPTAGGWKIGNDEVNATQTGFPNGTEGNVLPLILNELNAWNTANGNPGRGISVITCGLSGADCYPSTASWAPGHAAYNALTGTQVAASGVNAVRGVIWSNGPNADAVYAGVTGANYKTAIEAMLNGFVSTIGATYGIGGALNAVILSCGKVTLTGNDVTRQTINAVRSGPLLAVADGAPASNVVCTYDMALTDPVHWTQDAELLKVAGRYAAEMIRTWYSPAAYPAQPSLSTCFYDGNVTITLTFTGAQLDGSTTTFNPAAFRVVDNNLSGSITGATNATPIVITSPNHGLVTGATINMVSVGGNTNANGQWDVTRIDANTYSLINSSGNGAYTSGGTWTGGNPATISTAKSSVLFPHRKVILTLAAPTSSVANTRVSLGSGSDAVGLVVPVETPILLNSGNTLQRPAQPFFDVTPTSPPPPSTGSGLTLRVRGRGRRLRRI